ncbi:uncharacterized protein LOC143974400 [Lithobates pipiens]
METIFTVRSVLPPDCFMASLDLRDAYLHIPIREDSQKYLRIAILWGSQIRYLQFRALPFGLSSSPRIFTKVLAEALAPLRLKGIAVIPYLDDLLFFAPSKLQLQGDLRVAISCLKRLGWLINQEKSHLIPTQAIQYLGFLVDSVSQKVFLTGEKVEKVKEMVTFLQSNQTISIRSAMAGLGLLVATIPAVPWARAHFRCLQANILSSWDGTQESLDGTIHLSSKTKRSLWWWKREENLVRGLWWSPPVSVRITTDASAWGWGAHLGSKVAQGCWGKTQSQRLANWRELQAVWEALRVFARDLKDHHVQVLSDSIVAVSYLNKQGGTRCPSLIKLTSTIMHWAEENLKSVSAVHLKGVDNHLADFLSRHRVYESEWSLNREIFQLLVRKWGLPEVDLFARKANTQVPVYFSLEREAGAKGIDALAQSWAFHICYAFPPFKLIPLVLRTFLQERTTLILVVPYWPKRPWFSMLLGLTDEPPLILPEREDLLSQGPVLLPELQTLKLSAWRLKRVS